MLDTNFLRGLDFAAGLYGPSQKVFHSQSVEKLTFATGLYGPSQKVFHPLSRHAAIPIPIPGLALAQTRIPADAGILKQKGDSDRDL